MKRRMGFTLIELLVVIAIIALLLSIILPALRSVKKRAESIYCLSNIRSVMVGWTVYNQENNGRMVSAQSHYDYNHVQPHDWVHPMISTTDPRYNITQRRLQEKRS